jgi:propionyl-CoA synthetase
MSYADVYARWQSDPQGFWAEAAESIHWERRWDAVLDSPRPDFYRWYCGGVLNTCYNALTATCWVAARIKPR